MDREAWCAVVHGVAKSRTRLSVWTEVNSSMAQTGKNLPAVQETWGQSLGWEDLLEEGIATHFSVLAWRIPIFQRACQVALVVKNLPANAGDAPCPLVGKIPWRKAWKSSPVFLPEESHGRGALRAIVHRVAKTQTWLKRLSMHACIQYIHSVYKQTYEISLYI